MANEWRPHKNMKVCKIKGCKNKYCSKGFCKKHYQEQYRKINKIKIAKYQRNYDKQYRIDNKKQIYERRKRYRQKNKEYIAEKKKQYREKNKEYIAKHRKQYDQDHKKEKSEYDKLYRKTPIGRAVDRTHSSNRRTLTKDLTSEIVHQVYENNIKKYGVLTCYLCSKPIIDDDSLEHSTPLSRGGVNTYDNLGIAHLNCNTRKSTKTLEEWNKNR